LSDPAFEEKGEGRSADTGKAGEMSSWPLLEMKITAKGPRKDSGLGRNFLNQNGWQILDLLGSLLIMPKTKQPVQ
jgi:hypothetical protein